MVRERNEELGLPNTKMSHVEGEVGLVFPLDIRDAAQTTATMSTLADAQPHVQRHTPTVYEINADGTSWTAASATAKASHSLPEYHEQYRKLSSVSTLSSSQPGTPTSTVVTISPAGETILAVTVLRGASAEPLVAYVDWSHLSAGGYQVWKTQAFASTPSKQTTTIRTSTTTTTCCFQVLLLLSTPSLVTLDFRIEEVKENAIANAFLTLNPQTRLASLDHVWDVEDSRDATRVGFLGPGRRVLMANGAGLTVYDADEDTTVSWTSEEYALLGSSSYSSWMGWWKGHREYDYNMVNDAPPVSALHVDDSCVVGAEHDDACYYIYTLHTDGILYVRTLPATSSTLKPASIRSIAVPLPPNEVWVSVQMTSAVYPDRLCCVLGLQCTIPQPYTDALTPPVLTTMNTTNPDPSPTVLLVTTASRSVNDDANDVPTTNIRLVTPSNTNGPLTQLHLTPTPCTLRAIWGHATTDRWYTYIHGTASSFLQLNARETVIKTYENQLENNDENGKDIEKSAIANLICAMGGNGGAVVLVRPARIGVLVTQRHRPSALGDAGAWVRELDTAATAIAESFKTDLDEFRKLVAGTIAGGRLAWEYHRVEEEQGDVFRSILEDCDDMIPPRVQGKIRNQYDNVMKILTQQPMESYMGIYAPLEAALDGQPLLGHHTIRAVCELTWELLEKLCNTFLARALVIANCSPPRGNFLHVYLLSASMLYLSKQPYQQGRGNSTKTTTFLGAFLLQQSSGGHLPFGQGTSSSLANRTLQLVKYALQSLLNVAIDTKDPIFSLIDGQYGEVKDPHLALCCLAPHANYPEIPSHVALWTARCLIHTAHSHNSEDANAMARRAFALMRSLQIQDGGNLNYYLAKLQDLERLVDANGKPTVAQALYDHLHDLEVTTASSNAQLQTLLFRAAIKTKNFSRACTFCEEFPDLDTRFLMLKELVVSMVDLGALGALCQLCLRGDTEDTFRSASGLYDIACVTLEDMADRGDLYEAKVFSPPDTVQDYSMALQCIHVKVNNWKRVGECANERYFRAVRALKRSHIRDMSAVQQEERERLIMEDLARAAQTCTIAVSKIKDPDDQFLVTYADRTRWAPIMAQMMTKHFRSPVRSTSRRDIPHTLLALQLRKHRAKALLQLWTHDKGMAVEASKKDDHVSDTGEIVDRLCYFGQYSEALRLATIVDKVQPGVLNHALRHLCKRYLLPLMTPPSKGHSKPDFPLPSMQQIRQAVHLIRQEILSTGAESTNFAVSRPTGNHRTAESIHMAEIRTAVRALLELILTGFGNASNTFYIDVAKAMLLSHGYRRLPEWFEAFFLYGNYLDPLPGLFARRRLPDTPSSAFLGNSTALLTIYIENHLYTEAAHIVCRVLNEGTRDEHKAVSRLPEKGQIDWMPGPTIDLLWGMLHGILESNDVKPKHKDPVAKARDELKISLEQYSTSIQLSEDALRSSRMLAS